MNSEQQTVIEYLVSVHRAGKREAGISLKRKRSLPGSCSRTQNVVGSNAGKEPPVS